MDSNERADDGHLNKIALMTEDVFNNRIAELLTDRLCPYNWNTINIDYRRFSKIYIKTFHREKVNELYVEFLKVLGRQSYVFMCYWFLDFFYICFSKILIRIFRGVVSPKSQD